MPDVFGVWLLKSVICLGFGLWSLAAAWNNLVGFSASVAAIAGTTSMAPLKEDPPIATPFDRRNIAGDIFARAAVISAMLLQAGAGFALCFAALAASGLVSGADSHVAASIASTGLAMLAAAWLAMLIAGLWFAYWIRQEILQLTHIALLVATLVAALVINL